LKAWLLDQGESFRKFFYFCRKVGSYMAHTILDNWKVLPRLMMLAVTVLTYQAVHWFMGLDDPSVAQSGLVSVCMGALTGCFGIWMGKESKTSVTNTGSSSKVEYEVGQ
jgi:drug/metabolite transporter (DMT)-like permease